MGRIYKALMFNDEISVSLLETTDIVNQAIEYHNLTPVCAAALGRTLTVCSFMSTSLKNNNDSLTVTISGDGPCGHIVACADSDNTVRGYVDNPQVDIPLKENGKLDVGACVGKGSIAVIKNMGLKEPWRGSCPIVSGEIGEDFSAYYTYSEQQPTAISVGVKIGRDLKCIASGGLIIQPLPFASEESILNCEELLSHFGAISTLIETIGFDGIIEKYFKDIKFDKYETSYNCKCSKDRIDRVVLTLGKDELYKICAEEGKVQVTCHFCSKAYDYQKKDIDILLSENG